MNVDKPRLPGTNPCGRDMLHSFLFISEEFSLLILCGDLYICVYKGTLVYSFLFCMFLSGVGVRIIADLKMSSEVFLPLLFSGRYDVEFVLFYLLVSS